MKNKKTKKGFTLTELMLVIALMGIVTTFGIMSLTQGRARKEVEVGVRQLEAAIREAQGNALNGKQISGVSVCGFGVTVSVAGIITNYYKASGCAGGQIVISTEKIKSVTVDSAGIAGMENVFFHIPFSNMDKVIADPGKANFQITSTRDTAVIRTVCPTSTNVTDVNGASAC